ncbi:hypothetical protein ACQR05_28250 [Bradyrhizobium oligotrophicum]|uniref:hypothetical protein n=1 Tax=Bradyrhizobium oligotrophicum TaxID=44255 RepID=UPI003EBF3630
MDDLANQDGTAVADDADNLPGTWCWTKIGAIAELRGEKVDPGSDPDLRFVGMDDIEPNGLHATQSRPFGLMQSSANRFRPGDVLYGRLRPYLNKTALAAEHGACSGELLPIVPSVGVEPRFLQYFLHSRRFVNNAMSAVTGDRPRIDFARIGQFDFPLAPSNEQRRIVARIDELFAEIAAGEAALADARKGLETFRRALLKTAVTGELTKDWRESNPVSVSGHDLLQSIENPSSRKPRASLAPSVMPGTWAWTSLDQVASSVRNGTSAAPRASANENEILRISAVRPLYIDESQVRFLTSDQASDARDATVEAGDLLFTRYNGSADLVGVGALYQGKKRFYPDKVIRVRLHEAIAAISRFIEMSVNTAAGRKHIAANIKTTAGQQGISGASLRATPLPIPPPAEAAEIIRRVSDALSAADDTLASLDAEAADAARLKQAILKAAFEGRLMPQDPSDEPANALLARIAAERPTQPVKRGRGIRSAGKTA